jgi:DNA-binding IclR family transcriptional regulator
LIYVSIKMNKPDNLRITLIRVRVTTVAVDNTYYILCVCSLGYPVCKAHAVCYIVHL